MARPKNEAAYAQSRTKLLETGQHLFRTKSYADTGIAEVLSTANVPKGSFYHYFPTKEDFGIAVAQHYHDDQMATARRMLGDTDYVPLERLRRFFDKAASDMAGFGYAQGCLMCNLTTELADERPAFQAELDRQWRELVGELAICLMNADLNAIGLGHLTPQDAADWLMNCWSGALTRMKATRDRTPLYLFLNTVFKHRT